MTAAAEDFSSRAKASVRSESLRIRPSIVTRAIEPETFSVWRPPGVASTPTMAIAAIATATAATRQNVSLRRILRRSTMKSESSDIGHLLDRRNLAAAASKPGYSIASIAMQVEENKVLSPRRPGEGRGSMNTGICETRYGSRRVSLRMAVVMGPGLRRDDVDEFCAQTKKAPVETGALIFPSLRGALATKQSSVSCFWIASLALVTTLTSPRGP